MSKHGLDMPSLKDRVFSNLDNAKENGYIGSDGTKMNDWTDLDIACDLVCFASDLEDEDTEILVIWVKLWRKLGHEK